MGRNKYTRLHRWIGVVLLSCLGTFSLQAQDRYMVFLSDKDSVPYTLDNPQIFLSQEAIARRSQQNIPVDSSDLPIDPRYVAQLEQTGAQVYYTSRWFNAVLLAASDEVLPSVKELDFVTSVELVRPDRKGGRQKGGSAYEEAPGRPDAAARQKDQLLNMLQNEMLGIDRMHEEGYTGEGYRIAVFDGGFKGVDTVSFFQHLFEGNQMIPGYDFVGNSDNVYRYGQHGTQALSCIAAYEPGVLEAGAYDADIMLCVTEESGSEYRIEEYNWLFAAEMADSAGIDIISTSLGYTTFDDDSMNYNYEDLNGKTAAITRAVNFATSKGIVCVISAGNEGSQNWRFISPPADASYVLSVGAVSSSGERVSFSSWGPTADGRLKPDVSALGLQTVVVNADGDVGRSSGTSFSAPLIAGFTAGVWEALPELSNVDVIERIKLAGNQALAPDNALGYGVPNFSAVMASDDILTPLEEDKTHEHYRVYPNPLENGPLFIEFKTQSFAEPVEVYLYSMTAQLMMQKRYPFSNDPTITLDISGLAPGVYVMHILSSTESDTVKVIKF